jgi:hypothetical protein
MDPAPLNFAELRGRLVEGRYIGGILYYQVMNGITGTAMPYFKRELESEKIWDVSNYVAQQFIGLVDANSEPRGIDAAYEPTSLPARPDAGAAARRPPAAASAPARSGPAGR